LRRCKRGSGDHDRCALLGSTRCKFTRLGVGRLMLAGGAEGVRASDSTEIRFRVNLDRPTLVGYLVAPDNSEDVLAGCRMLTVRREQVICLGILAGFPWVNGVCTCKVCHRFLRGYIGAHLIVGEEVDVCARLPKYRPSEE
jgi:hypothetical protein